METLFWPAVFLISLAVLVKASDLLVRAAEKIGRSLGMPAFVIGAIIIGIGTSLPELISSLLAVLEGVSEIVIGNTVGSNITNIFLVLGVTGLIGRDIRIRHDLLSVDLPFLLGSSFMLVLTVWDCRFSVFEAYICLTGLVIYLLNIILGGSSSTEESTPRPAAGARQWILLIISGILIFFSAKYTVVSVIRLSSLFAIGAEVIALSAVALGTSLPEVIVSATAARRGNPEMAIGNIMGSNIFNTFAVMGIPGIVGRLTVPASVVDFPVPVFFAATLICVIITLDKKINRSEGALLVLFYVLFIGKLFVK